MRIRDMARRRILGWLIRTLLLLLGIVAGGYMSSSISLQRAEQRVANRIAAELGTRDVFVGVDDSLGPGDVEGTREVLARAGFAVRRCQRRGSDSACFPWASVSRGRVRGPLLVDVRWAVAKGGLSGHGTRTLYLALFGFVVPIREITE
jgi:hypothetical protein